MPVYTKKAINEEPATSVVAVHQRTDFKLR
jgi:hypothetical protein